MGSGVGRSGVGAGDLVEDAREGVGVSAEAVDRESRVGVLCMEPLPFGTTWPRSSCRSAWR
ncbi:hypothetical protein ACIQPR_08920 [Streptomyces sp. NPDC091280]|uniref:hypothetical protein n=1 Tax=Streptomyces sp. NPDC091280 TaxID=3365984 RepID=UPI00380139B0